MAKYRAIDNQTGDEVNFEWHDIHPPTDSDLEEVFAEYRAQKVKAKTPVELFPEGAPPGELNVGAFQLPPGSGEMLGATVPAGVAGMINPALGIGTLMALSAGGAGLGNLIEQGVGRLTTGRPIEPLEAGAAATRGLAGELAGGVVGSALKVGPEGAAGLKLAREAGLPTSASRYTGGWLPKTLQTIADWTPAGRAIENAYRSKLIGKVTQWRTDLVRKMMGLPVEAKEELGEAVGESIRAIKDADAIYGQMNEILKPMKQVGLRNTENWLAERGGIKIIKEMGWAPASAEYRILKKINNKEQLNGENVSFMLGKVWKKFSSDPPFVASIKGELKDAILADLDVYEAANLITIGDLKRQADVAFGAASEWIKTNPILKKAFDKFKGEPYYQKQSRNFFDSLFDPANTEAALEVKGILKDQGKPELWDAAIGRKLEDMLETYTKRNEVTGEMTFQPAGFADEYAKFRPSLEKLAPEVLSKADEFAELARVSAPEFKMKAKEFPWLPMGILTGGAGAGLGPVTGVAVPNGFGALAAWGLMGTDKAARFIQTWGIQAGAATAKGLALPTKAGTIRGLQELTSEE